jgi:hypothetical protein
MRRRKPLIANRIVAWVNEHGREIAGAAVLAALLTMFCVVFNGCIQGTAADGTPTTSVDPNVFAMAEKGVQAGLDIGAVLLPVLFPAALPILGYVAAALRVGRKLKPRIVSAEVKTERYHLAASALVTAVDEFRKSYPKDWSKLGDKIAKTLNVEKRDVENVVRGLRGKPPKV